MPPPDRARPTTVPGTSAFWFFGSGGWTLPRLSAISSISLFNTSSKVFLCSGAESGLGMGLLSGPEGLSGGRHRDRGVSRDEEDHTQISQSWSKGIQVKITATLDPVGVSFGPRRVSVSLAQSGETLVPRQAAPRSAFHLGGSSHTGA